MKDITIRNVIDGKMLHLKDCVQIRPSNVHYSDEDKARYRIIFEWVKDSTTWEFESEIERDNFLEHVSNALEPIDMDPKQKPLKL